MPEESTVENLRDRIVHLEAENKKWMRLAGINRLTNLPNNLMLYQIVLPRELRKGGPLAVSLACIMLCPDGLGEINQNHGRLIGDELIVNIGQFLKSKMVEKEQLFHVDGANFVVLMLDAPESSARRKATQLKNEFKEHSFTGGKKTFKDLTFSAGINEVESLVQEKEVVSYIDQIYQELSDRLYKAKEKNGNAIVGSR